MKFKLTNIIFVSFILSGLFFWNLAQSDTTKALKTKPDYYFKMESVEKGRFLVKKLGCNDCHTNGYLQSKGNIPENIYMAFACQEKTSPVDRKMERNNIRLNP